MRLRGGGGAGGSYFDREPGPGASEGSVGARASRACPAAASPHSGPHSGLPRVRGPGAGPRGGGDRSRVLLWLGPRRRPPAARAHLGSCLTHGPRARRGAPKPRAAATQDSDVARAVPCGFQGASVTVWPLAGPHAKGPLGRPDMDRLPFLSGPQALGGLKAQRGWSWPATPLGVTATFVQARRHRAGNRKRPSVVRQFPLSKILQRKKKKKVLKQKYLV